jgi:hypothetical protein
MQTYYSMHGQYIINMQIITLWSGKVLYPTNDKRQRHVMGRHTEGEDVRHPYIDFPYKNIWENDILQM